MVSELAFAAPRIHLDALCGGSIRHKYPWADLPVKPSGR